VTEYPRVLIVYMSCINRTDDHGLSLRSWFGGWPTTRLAQIYSGADQGGDKFCAQTFQLGPPERHLGSLFFALKQSSVGQSTYPIDMRADTQRPLRRQSRMARSRSRVASTLLRSGLWELLFPPRLSERLLRWLDSFHPEVIYCQGYSLTFARLPIALSQHLGIPVCFQTGDDWPTYLYRDSVVAWAVRPSVARAVEELVRCSSARLANGDRMAAEYSARFGQPFVPMMMGDRIERFRAVEPVRLGAPGAVSVVYSGGLGQGRWQSVADLCQAAGALGKAGYNIKVTAFAPVVPREAVNLLRDTATLQVLRPPAHDALPAYLRGADILLLPETFDAAMAAEIRLSISSKAHLYMMSERPVLVYGSPVTGIVDYARRDGWAHVVDRPNPHELVTGLRRLIDDKDLRQTLVRRGVDVALRNHEETGIRQRFAATLSGIAGRPQGVTCR